MQIAALDWIWNKTPVWFYRFERWAEIGRTLNVDFEFNRVTDKEEAEKPGQHRLDQLAELAKKEEPDSEVARKRLLEDWARKETVLTPVVTPGDLAQAGSRTLHLLKEADAFVTDGSVFMSNRFPKALTLLQKRVAEGARVFFHVRNPRNIELFRLTEEFLRCFDMAPTAINIRGKRPDTELIHFRRDENCLRDSQLFAEVDEVLAWNPYALWCEGRSLPVLVASHEHWALQSRTDLPADAEAYLRNYQNLPERELKQLDLPEGFVTRDLACMGVWYQEDNVKSGAVLAAGGGFYFCDPWDNACGMHRPSIEQNKRLASNVLRFLCGKQSPPPHPRDLSERIERNMVAFVLGVLKLAANDWWTQHISLPIRQKCSSRQEEEGNRFPKEAYLDLIDLKTIMQKEWKLFEPRFASVGIKGGKEKSLAWMDRLNEIRRLVAHPIKQELTEHVFPSEDLAFLSEWDRLVLGLRQSLKADRESA